MRPYEDLFFLYLTHAATVIIQTQELCDRQEYYTKNQNLWLVR
ncbi:MAG: hypothetical protein RM021_013785 [Nostoc sp. EkiNYC01]|nr:hypothetical protein [Nostoc sp. EkiNYC01]